MKKHALMAVVIAGLTIPAEAQEHVEWSISRSGGSIIELPTFMTEGWVRGLMQMGEDYGTAFEPERYPVQLRQYRTDSKGRPFDYLQDLLGENADEVTYTFDRDHLGAISGFTKDRTEIFYGMCRKENVVVCFDMHWPKEMQSFFGPIAERIAKGFRDGL